MKSVTSKVIPLLFSAVCLALFTGCSDDSSGPDLSDLTDNEKQLVGTWLLTETEGEPNPGPVDYAVIKWTFEADGSGEYYQKPNNRDETSRDIYWRMEGDDILFTDQDGQGSPVYRVEIYGEQEMTWFNYTLDNYYIVEKQ